MLKSVRIFFTKRKKKSVKVISLYILMKNVKWFLFSLARQIEKEKKSEQKTQKDYDKKPSNADIFTDRPAPTGIRRARGVLYIGLSWFFTEVCWLFF